MEQEGKLPWAMEMQRLYAWQALGETKAALDRLQILSRNYPASNELAFLRADLLTSKHEWESAARVLKHVKDENPNTPVAQQAAERLESLPPVANIDKWYWGEAYVSGDYLGRFGTVIGSGFIRHGFYIQNLRWLQPYAEMRFSADTRSGVRERSLITDNFVGFYGGVRAQLLPTEYLFVYAQGGVSVDLLERRHHGDWANDYQVGIYGFKSWGPGTILLSRAPGDEISSDRQFAGDGS